MSSGKSYFRSSKENIPFLIALEQIYLKYAPRNYQSGIRVHQSTLEARESLPAIQSALESISRANEARPIESSSSLSNSEPKLMIDIAANNTKPKKHVSFSPDLYVADIVADLVTAKFGEERNERLSKLKRVSRKIRYALVNQEDAEYLNTLKIIFGKDETSDVDLKAQDLLKQLTTKQSFDVERAPEVVQVFNFEVNHNKTNNDEVCDVDVSYDEVHESEYSEVAFLRNALGEYIANRGSAATDEASALLSTISSSTRVRNQTRKTDLTMVNTYYDGVQCPRYSEASYETVSESDGGMSGRSIQDVRKEIKVYETTIEQIEKMFRYCTRAVPNYVSSEYHLEGERILLLSKIRQEVLLQQLQGTLEPAEKAVATVIVRNLQCTLKTLHDDEQQYFLCVLQHRTTVLATRIVSPNKLGCVMFDGFFVFRKVSKAFSITIDFYSITIKKRQKICIPTAMWRTTPKLPMMKFVGQSNIGIENVRNNRFTFRNAQNHREGEHKLGVIIGVTVDWPEPLKGFINLGTSKVVGQPVLWNRRWAVLREDILYYYGCPSAEFYSSAIGVVDFKKVKEVRKSVEKHLGHQGLDLFVEEDRTIRMIVITADTQEDQDLWAKQIKVVMTLIHDWNIVETS